MSANKVLKDENAVLHKAIIQGRDVNEVSPRNENPSVVNEVEMQHLLKGDTNIIHSCIKKKKIIKKVSKEMERTIAGVAVLENLIYVVSDKSSEVDMFDVGTLQFKRRCNLEKLENPWDLTSCKLNKCLYIMDLTKTKYHIVIRVDALKMNGPNVEAFLTWSTGEEYGTLSVSSDGNVVVAVRDDSRLLICYPDGKQLKTVSLTETRIHPSHALMMNNGQFLISHGMENDNIHRVIILSANGEIRKNSVERMETPSYLAMDETGQVFVADQGNSRVCMLNSDLELIGEVASKRNGLRSPQRIFLIGGETRKLFVADNKILPFEQRNGKLLMFKYN